MKKFDNFSSCLDTLNRSNTQKAADDEIYRMGVIGQFNLCFELAWKALQAVLALHGVSGAVSGSPREIIKLGYQVGFVNDEEIWIDMLKKRNMAVHIYSEPDAEEMLALIYGSYAPALEKLRETLKEKIEEIEKI